jgi:hypothetical protein
VIARHQGLKPYWGKPTVRNFRGGAGNVRDGRTRTPLHASKEWRAETLGLRLRAPVLYSTLGKEEPLRLARRFEPLHPPLPLSSRLMGVLRTIVEILLLAIFYPGEDFALGSSVALEFIGHDHARLR